MVIVLVEVIGTYATGEGTTLASTLLRVPLLKMACLAGSLLLLVQ